MDKKNKRTLTFNNLEFRTVQQDNGQPEKPVISGYAAVYNSESELMYGFFREVIRPGAFDSSLQNDIRCLWNHDTSYVLGRTIAGTLSIRSDAKGLYFEVNPPETTWANDLSESIKRGDINQMSFGFLVNEDNWETLEDGTEMRELLDVDLFEVSVCTFPAYTATSAGVRSIDQAEEEVKKRFEERTKEKPSEPEKRFFDYLKIMQAFDSRSKKDPDEDSDDDTDSMMDDDQDMMKKGKKRKNDPDMDGDDDTDPNGDTDNDGGVIGDVDTPQDQNKVNKVNKKVNKK